jgi:hypothetical protein
MAGIAASDSTANPANASVLIDLKIDLPVWVDSSWLMPPRGESSRALPDMFGSTGFSLKA